MLNFNKASGKDNTEFDISTSALMSENPLGMKSRKAIAILHKLMTNAIYEGREEEMIQKIVPRITKIKNWAKQDSEHIAFARKLDEASKSPALRLFNLQAKAAGRNEMLYDETGTANNLSPKEQTLADILAKKMAQHSVRPLILH